MAVWSRLARTNDKKRVPAVKSRARAAGSQNQRESNTCRSRLPIRLGRDWACIAMGVPQSVRPPVHSVHNASHRLERELGRVIDRASSLRVSF